MSKFKLFRFRLKVDSYTYGTCNGRYARRHDKNGNVQFILWKKGDQAYVDGIGHKEDKWHDFDNTWWGEFLPQE